MTQEPREVDTDADVPVEVKEPETDPVHVDEKTGEVKPDKDEGVLEEEVETIASEVTVEEEKRKKNVR